MGRLLVHITCGPEAPTRAALGLLVSRAAVEEGHEVNVFLAGDAVQLVRDAVLDSLAGLVTGVTEGVVRRRGGRARPVLGVRHVEQGPWCDRRGPQRQAG